MRSSGIISIEIVGGVNTANQLLHDPTLDLKTTVAAIKSLEMFVQTNNAITLLSIKNKT